MEKKAQKAILALLLINKFYKKNKNETVFY
jgi:hypothetical protein